MSDQTNEGSNLENNPQQTASDSGQDNQPTLTQADVDKVVSAAKRSAKKQGETAILEALGVKNIEDVKTALSEAEAAKQAQMSDLEKVQAELAKANEARIQAEQTAIEAKAYAENQLIDAAIITASQEFNDPNDVLQFIDRSNIERDESGTLVGIEDAVKALSESKPYLLKSVEVEKPKGTSSRQPQQNIGQQPPPNSLQQAWNQTRSTVKL